MKTRVDFDFNFLKPAFGWAICLLLTHGVGVSPSTAQQNPSRTAFANNVLAEFAPNHCGVYSLFAIACALNKPAALNELVTADYVSSEFGSSASDLIRAARALNLHAAAIEGWSVAALRSSGNPALLNLKISNDSKCGHWVAWLGEKDGQAIIYDPLSKLERVPLAVLFSRWNGSAVIVSDSPIGTGMIVRSMIAWFAWLLTPLTLISVMTFAHSRFQASSGVHFYKRTCIGVALILMVSVIWTALDAALNSANSIRTRESAIAVRCHGSAELPNEIALVGDNLIESLVGNSRVTLVDARPEAYFHQYSLPGAVNIPVNAPLFDFIKAISSLDPSRDVVVFCERSSCQWDQMVARRLCCCGFDNVRVYQPGIEGYLRLANRKN